MRDPARDYLVCAWCDTAVILVRLQRAVQRVSTRALAGKPQGDRFRMWTRPRLGRPFANDVAIAISDDCSHGRSRRDATSRSIGEL